MGKSVVKDIREEAQLPKKSAPFPQQLREGEGKQDTSYLSDRQRVQREPANTYYLPVTV